MIKSAIPPGQHSLYLHYMHKVTYTCLNTAHRSRGKGRKHEAYCVLTPILCGTTEAKKFLVKIMGGGEERGRGAANELM